MKKGQFWYGDFLVAVLILMIIGFLFVASIRDISSRNEVLKDLIIDASEISSTLMSEGTGDQDDWNNLIGTVGLITDYKLDRTKFTNFLGLRNYDTQKSMLGTFNNVWVYLLDRDGNIIDHNGDKIQEGLGLEEEIEKVQDINANNLVHIKRFVFYNGDIHTLGVVVWR